MTFMVSFLYWYCNSLEVNKPHTQKENDKLNRCFIGAQVFLLYFEPCMFVSVSTILDIPPKFIAFFQIIYTLFLEKKSTTSLSICKKKKKPYDKVTKKTFTSSVSQIVTYSPIVMGQFWAAPMHSKGMECTIKGAFWCHALKQENHKSASEELRSCRTNTASQNLLCMLALRFPSC